MESIAATGDKKDFLSVIEWLSGVIVDSFAAAIGSNLGYRFRRRQQAQNLECTISLAGDTSPRDPGSSIWRSGHLIEAKGARPSAVFRSGRVKKQDVTITFRDKDIAQLTEAGGREVSVGESLWVNRRCRIYGAMIEARVIELAILPEDLNRLVKLIGSGSVNFE